MFAVHRLGQNEDFPLEGQEAYSLSWHSPGSADTMQCQESAVDINLFDFWAPDLHVKNEIWDYLRRLWTDKLCHNCEIFLCIFKIEHIQWMAIIP